MILSNVNIGTGPSAGDGDPLRTAFNTINENFERIESNVNALTNSVSSVAGRTGNVVLTTQDIIGINNYATVSYVNSQLANAGAANISSLQSNVAALQADVNTLYGNAGVQSSTLATLTANAAAQAGSLATLTSNAASQAGELSSLLANAAVQAGQISSLAAGAYGNSNVAVYLTTYAGNVRAGNIIFDDLSVQTTAYTGTQWRSNLESNVRVKPSWLSYVPGGKNQEGTQYGFDTGGMFFTSNADNDFAYPIQTNLHFHEQDVLEVIATIYFGATNNDHGLCIFPANERPVWQSSSNTTRIAFQYTAGIPVLYGQTTANTAPGSPVLSTGNYYTIKFKYDPGNTVIVETFSGNTATGSPVDTRSLAEVLPAGDYRLGFDADNDAAGVKSYWTNLVVRTLTNTVVNDLEVQGQVIGNLIPQSNVAQTLGNITHQWKDLFVSNNTIYIGGVPLSVDAGGNLLVNSAPVSAGTATGIISATSIAITNADNSNSADINLLSGDDITLQGKNKTTSDSEGGDIFIYAGRGGDADSGDSAGSGGDVTIRGGAGGSPSATYGGGSGGTVDIFGGDGADADLGFNKFARGGGGISLQAGNAGYNGGDTSLGAIGGDVSLSAGDTSLEDENGGDVNITTGSGGAGSAQSGDVRITIPVTGAFPGGEWIFSGTGTTLSTPQDAEIFGAGAGNLTVGSAGNTFIRSVNYSTLTPYTWQFSDVGVLTLPGNVISGNGQVNFVANSSGDGNGYSTIELRPDVNQAGTDQYLIVDPTAPGHIHIRAGGEQDNSSADLIFGGENSHVKIPAGANTSPYIKSNGYEWQFGTDGILTLAAGGSIYAPVNDPIDIRVQDSGNVGYAIEQSVRDGTNTLQTLTSLDRQEFKIYTDFQGSNNLWTFAKSGQFRLAGNLRFPDTTVQTTAWTGTVAYGNTIAIGYQTGNTSQGNNAVAIGSTAGQTSQGAKAIGIGEVAGRLNQGIESIGLGAGAGEQNQGAYAIAIGSTTAYLNQGVGAVAIGTSAGALYQGEHAIAIGTGAGNGLQGNNSIILNATGGTLDQTTDDTFTVKPIRSASAGNVLYYNPSSGEITYSTFSVTYGNTIALGYSAGVDQGEYSVAIGSEAGATTQGNLAVAVGRKAGSSIQGDGAVAVGESAGWAQQGEGAVAVGREAALADQSAYAVAIGYNAGADTQGAYSIAIGQGAGTAFQPANSIIINSSADSLNTSTAGLYINPIRNTTGNVGVLQYNNATKEVSYSANVTLGNISAGNVFANGISGKIGYSAGGYVVQSGNTSGITLNTVSGNIQLDTVNIAVNTSHTVALTNNKLDANDIILVQGQDSSALDLHIGAYYLTTNTALIYLRNISGSSIGPIAPTLKFIIIKAPGS